MSEKTIPASKVEKLIGDYEAYEQECVDFDLAHDGDKAIKARAKASLYRTVIGDLETLLPRKTMADIPVRDWESYEGAWAELNGVRCLIVKVCLAESFPIRVLYTDTGDIAKALPGEVTPLDEDRAW